MTTDIPIAFVQTEVKQNKLGERITMKIKVVLIDISVVASSQIYEDYEHYMGCCLY
jgi:hypothetical protein